MGNFNTYDWATFAGVTGISFPIGWVSGKICSLKAFSFHRLCLLHQTHTWCHPMCVGMSSKTPIPMMWTAVTIGGLAGFMMAYQQSAGEPDSSTLPEPGT